MRQIRSLPSLESDKRGGPWRAPEVVKANGEIGHSTAVPLASLARPIPAL